MAACGEEGVERRLGAGAVRQPAPGRTGLEQDRRVAPLAEQHGLRLLDQPDADEVAGGRIEIQPGMAERFVVALTRQRVDEEYPHAPCAEPGVRGELELVGLAPARVEVGGVLGDDQRRRVLGGEGAFVGVRGQHGEAAVVERSGRVVQHDLRSRRASVRRYFGRDRPPGRWLTVRAELLRSSFDVVAEGIEPVERGGEGVGVGCVEEREHGVAFGRGSGRERLGWGLGAGREGKEQEEDEGAHRLGVWGARGEPTTLGFVAMLGHVAGRRRSMETQRKLKGRNFFRSFLLC